MKLPPTKKNPADFILWKPSTEGQPQWDSPWGLGRPGWHIECSAMSYRYLGDSFDIHAGGQDLIFPHHQNEIAQSCCAYPNSTFAKYWMHNGYVISEGNKMSKSLGNFYTVAELLKDFSGEAIRFVLLQTHYRQPLDFSIDKLKTATHILNKFYNSLFSLNMDFSQRSNQSTLPTDEKILSALSDDLNTPKAISVLHEYLNALNKSPTKEKAFNLINAANLMGLLQQNPNQWHENQQAINNANISTSQINDLIKERNEAKKTKNFDRADEIRDILKSHNIVLKDTAKGTIWQKEA